MTRPFKLAGGVAILVVVLVAGLYVYRSLMLWGGRTPEGFQILTPVPGATGFEPTTLPTAPVLESQSPSDLAVNFGYKVGGVPYSYSLVLAFPPGAEEGRVVLTARHSNRSASSESPMARRWDEPRKAYAVALASAFSLVPSVPALCVKAVIGPDLAAYKLGAASICIAQRDATGQCHPETLACGLIR